jgi:hypothetical protein
LYFIYRKNKGNNGKTKRTTTQEESMEMGTAKPSKNGMGDEELKGDTS